MISVLHVDDEPELVELVASYLKREDDRINVTSATHPDEALEILDSNEFDCVVSDYDMPKLNGIEFLKEVRVDFQDLPFILFTGKGSEEVASDAISAGVTDYLQKETGTSQYTVLANRIGNSVAQARAHQSVQETEQKLTELAEQTDDILVMYDGKWEEVLFVNSAYEDVWGAPVEELKADPTSYLEYVHPDHREEVTAANRAIQAGEPCDLEYRIVRPDGTQRWVSVDGEPIFDESGEVSRIAVQVGDITERKEHELHLGTLISNLPGYMYRHALEPDFSLEFVMGDSESITGYTPEELEEEVEMANEVIHPEARDWVAASLERDLEATGEFDLTYRIVTKDEEVRWVRDQGQLIEDTRTGDEHLDGFVTDVTEQRRQEIELARTSELQRHSEELTDIGGWEIDAETGRQRWTEGTYLIHDIDPKGVFEPTVDGGIEFYHPEDRDIIADAVERCLSEGETYELELRLITAAGRERYVHTRGVPLEQDGEIVGARGAIQDVTERRERERELERINDFFTQAELLGDLGAWEFDGDGDVYWTDGTRQIHGVGDDFEPTLGDGIDFFHPDDRDQVKTAVHRALEDGEAYDIEARIVTQQEETRWVRTSGGPREGGNTIRGFIQDITEQKEREAAFEQAKNQLEAAVSAGDVGTWEWDIDSNTLFLDPAFAERFGVSSQAAKEGIDLETALGAIHPEDRDDVAAAIQEAIDTCGRYEKEYRLTEGDGTRWALARGTVECDEDGHALNFPGILIDITQRKQQERQLERAHEEYRALFNGMNDSAWVIGLDEQFRAVNDTAVEKLGYSRDELINMRPHDIDEGLEPGEISELIREMPKDELQIFETIHRTKDGREIPVEISSTLITYQGDTAVLSVARDISGRKRRERQLEEFASVVSHDLRNPLSVAQGRVELAREEVDSEHLDRAIAAHQRMNALISDLLTLAREGDQVQDPEPITIDEEVHRAWQHVKTGEATLEIDIDGSTRADRSRLAQVFENLFRNAIDHGGEDVAIRVGQLEDGFFIEDDGPGIPEDKRETVFDVGYSTSHDGNGFGLSIVEQIVKAHGWAISITEGSAGGARFLITGIDFLAEEPVGTS